MTENTTWVSRTDGLPVCKDCAFYDSYYKKCVINRMENCSLNYPSSCNFYQSKKVGE
jgi:hypothetical protein